MVKQLSVLVLASAVSMSLLAGCSCGDAPEKPKPKPEGTQHVAPQENKSGLTHTILTEGTGEVAKKGQKATVHYTGWLAKNGEPDMNTKFDSSVDRGTPFSFVIAGGMVIKGWDLGVEGMKVGEKRRLVIPSELGYGSRGAGGRIPPNATLVFDVELLAVS